MTIFPPFSQCLVEQLIPVDPVADLERRVRDGSTELVLAPSCNLVGNCEHMQLTVVCDESQNKRSQLRVISASILTSSTLSHDWCAGFCLTTRSYTNQTQDDVCCAHLVDAANQ